ncbi:MAG: SGNH/GDSL hydrolase family protein [Lachnospiraceae bacterium]|nr:SGNH/GDSL hydrolase family protein [Lachnospiraceae bacterium]
MKRSYKIICTLLLSIVAIMTLLVLENEKHEVTRAASVMHSSSTIIAKEEQENAAMEAQVDAGLDEVGMSLTPEQTQALDEERTRANLKKYKSVTEKDKHFFKELEKLYHEEKNTNKYADFDMTALKEKITEEYYLARDMALCGDSYCGLLSRYMRKRKNFKGEVFAEAGKSVVANKQKYIDAINSDKDIIILSTSVNDVLVQTSLKEFKKTIEELFKLSYEKGKLFIIHTNTDFMGKDSITANNSMKYELSPKYYDWVIITSAAKYGNVTYVDLNDIATPEALVDGIHYGESFYNILIDRIYNELQQKFGF